MHRSFPSSVVFCNLIARRVSPVETVFHTVSPSVNLSPRFPFCWLIAFVIVLCCFSSCRTQVVERSHSRDVSVAVASSDSLSSRVSDSRRLSDVRRYYTEYVYDSVSVIPAPASQLQNCTQPSTLNPQLLSTLNPQPQTTYHYRERLRARTDTVFLSDTVCIHDTLFVRSSSSRMDTVIHTDTIYLPRPLSGGYGRNDYGSGGLFSRGSSGGLFSRTAYGRDGSGSVFSRTTPEPTFGMSPRTCVGRFFVRLGSALLVFLRALEACLACVGAVRVVRFFIR